MYVYSYSMNTTQIQKIIENEPTLKIGEFSESVKISGKKYIYWNNEKVVEINEKTGKMTRIAEFNTWIKSLDIFGTEITE